MWAGKLPHREAKRSAEKTKNKQLCGDSYPPPKVGKIYKQAGTRCTAAGTSFVSFKGPRDEARRTTRDLNFRAPFLPTVDFKVAV